MGQFSVEIPPESGSVLSATQQGTIVQPDELVLLSAPLRAAVLTHSPYSTGVASTPSLPWDKWMANKHMVYTIAAGAEKIAKIPHARDGAAATMNILAQATKLHSAIAAEGIRLRDETNSYQECWRRALNRALAQNADDYQWLFDVGR